MGIAHFCLLWAEGLHATVQMTSLGDGKARAKLEFELGKPGDIFRRGTPRGGAWRQPRHHQPGSLPVPGHPGRTGNRRAVEEKEEILADCFCGDCV